MNLGYVGRDEQQRLNEPDVPGACKSLQTAKYTRAPDTRKIFFCTAPLQGVANLSPRHSI